MSIFDKEHEASLAAMPPMLRRSVIGSLCLYVFRGTDQAEIREVLKSRQVDFEFLSWRRHLHRNGEFLRNGKIFLYQRHCGLNPRPKDFELSRRDSAWLNSALEFQPLHRRLEALRVEEGREPISMQEFDKFAATVLQHEGFLTYIRKYIRKKMSFLRASYNVTFRELESDLCSWAFYALLRAYPRLTDIDHGVAIANTIAKRRGVNLIKGFTAQKNNALVTQSDGSCERTSVSLSHLADGTGQFLSDDGSFIHRSLLVVGINGLSSAASNVSWDTLHSLNELTTSDSFTSHQQRFLRLMMGTPDQEFSAWLSQPNEEYVHRVDYDQYQTKVCEFLGLPAHLASRFLTNLRSHLGATS